MKPWREKIFHRNRKEVSLFYIASEWLPEFGRTSGSKNASGSFILMVCPFDLTFSRSSIIHAQTYLSAEPPPPFQDARLSHENENQERTGRAIAPPRQGTQARFRKTRLSRLVSLEEIVPYAPSRD